MQTRSEISIMANWEKYLGLSSRNYKSDNYNSTKDFLFNQHVWEIYTLRHLKVGILREQGRQDRQKDKDGNHRWSQALVAARGNTVAVEGYVVTPYTVDRGAEAAFWPAWLVHIEAEGSACCGTAAMTRRKKKVQTHKSTPPKHPPIAQWLLADWQQWRHVMKGQKQHSRWSGLYSLWLNPVGKTKPKVHKPASPLCPNLHSCPTNHGRTW